MELISRAPTKLLCEGHFFHLSNLFISSALSATVGDFYGYSHNIATLPVTFSTVEQRNRGRLDVFHIEILSVLCLMSHQP